MHLHELGKTIFIPNIPEKFTCPVSAVNSNYSRSEISEHVNRILMGLDPKFYKVHSFRIGPAFSEAPN